MAAVPTIPWGHPSVPAAHLATIILGGGVSSRLWRDVRERKGLAYHVGCSLTFHRDAGVSVIEAATAPKNVGKLARTAGRVLSRMRRDGISATELSRARNQVRAEIALSLESTAARREAAARAWLYRGRPHEADEVLAEFDAVKRDDVDEIAARLLVPPLAVGTSGPNVDGITVEELAGELAA
jgi:predicted Zn-dependent peptidase